MPLEDHFRPPLSVRRQWNSFLQNWATYLGESLNTPLPDGYFAESHMRIGIEVDIGTMREGESEFASGWSPPNAALTITTATATDVVEILVFSTREGPVLVGAIELVNPSNKDRPGEREAFVDKCAAYLHRQIGLVIVDIVTERRANLHAALVRRLVNPVPELFDSHLYATAYRPRAEGEETHIAVWQEALALGQPLPTMPLWLTGGPFLPVELEATYEGTCRKQKIPRSDRVQAS